jgi:hypothetical protein
MMIKLRDGSLVEKNDFDAFIQGFKGLISECPDAFPLMAGLARICHGLDHPAYADSYFQSHWRQYGFIDKSGNIPLHVALLMKNCAVPDSDDLLGWRYQRPEMPDIAGEA